VTYLEISGVFYPWVSPCAGSSFHPFQRWSFDEWNTCRIRSFKGYLQCM